MAAGAKAAPPSAPAPWLREEDGAVVLALHVQPGAKRTQAEGAHGDALKVRLAAPPVDGKANAELVRFLAEAFGVRRPSGSSRRRAGRTAGGVAPRSVEQRAKRRSTSKNVGPKPDPRGRGPRAGLQADGVATIRQALQRLERRRAEARPTRDSDAARPTPKPS